MENESGTYNFGARLGEGMEKKIIIILFCLPLIKKGSDGKMKTIQGNGS